MRKEVIVLFFVLIISVELVLAGGGDVSQAGFNTAQPAVGDSQPLHPPEYYNIDNDQHKVFNAEETQEYLKTRGLESTQCNTGCSATVLKEGGQESVVFHDASTQKEVKLPLEDAIELDKAAKAAGAQLEFSDGKANFKNDKTTISIPAASLDISEAETSEDGKKYITATDQNSNSVRLAISTNAAGKQVIDIESIKSAFNKANPIQENKEKPSEEQAALNKAAALEPAKPDEILEVDNLPATCSAGQSWVFNGRVFECSDGVPKAKEPEPEPQDQQPPPPPAKIDNGGGNIEISPGSYTVPRSDSITSPGFSIGFGTDVKITGNTISIGSAQRASFEGKRKIGKWYFVYKSIKDGTFSTQGSDMRFSLASSDGDDSIMLFGTRPFSSDDINPYTLATYYMSGGSSVQWNEQLSVEAGDDLVKIASSDALLRTDDEIVLGSQQANVLPTGSIHWVNLGPGAYYKYLGSRR